MMIYITNSIVNQLYHRIQDELFAMVNQHHWSIQPVKWTWTPVKTKYGMADRQGIIYLNQLFKQTVYFELLEAVFRHEFAHLCVGLQQGHNTIFKQCEHRFKARFNAVAKQQAIYFEQRIDYKYLLVAELYRGDTIVLKKTHRKHRKYTNYCSRRHRCFYYQQQPIRQFRYILIKDLSESFKIGAPI